MVDIKSIIKDNISVKKEMLDVCTKDIQKAAELMSQAIKCGKKIIGV